MYALRKLMQGSPETPKAPLGNNARPIQQLHHRTVRTNIDFFREQGKNCPTMYKDHYYAGEWPSPFGLMCDSARNTPRLSTFVLGITANSWNDDSRAYSRNNVDS
ncbi:hypothetical protein ONE63_006149 [Megalurothrips usitatus]|uniref:Alpha-carbonic anhydrase domain-containing protein n=1 Tax=Megalurothrips usitatus TaxID=439358 RepID=A0AAV7XVQ1_9NEOP|nr:hypothetical protein ONE63_006149 [Megalurothrips usitatus]